MPRRRAETAWSRQISVCRLQIEQKAEAMCPPLFCQLKPIDLTSISVKSCAGSIRVHFRLDMAAYTRLKCKSVIRHYAKGKTVKQKETTGGFTLVEVIVVLVILAILAAIGIPAYTKYIEMSKSVVCSYNRNTAARAYSYYALENEGATLAAFINDPTLFAAYELDGCPDGGDYYVSDDGRALLCTLHGGAATGQPEIIKNQNMLNAYQSLVSTNTWWNSDIYAPAKAFDGKATNSRWASMDNGAPSSLTMVLNGPTTLNTIQIEQYKNRIKSYTISYKAAGSDEWQVLTVGGAIAGQDGNTRGTYETISFAATTVTELKFDFTPNGKDGVSIWDIQGSYQG